MSLQLRTVGCSEVAIRHRSLARFRIDMDGLTWLINKHAYLQLI